MCGIGGILERSGGRIRPEELWRLTERLGHRGPDDRGIYHRGPIGLAQTRLAIVGLASGHQPLVSRDGRLALVANGEVYNDPELRRRLTAEGCRFQTDSDSETILQAYARDERAFLTHLRGMYAFALWDDRKQRLILARDRLGIKPLFYSRQGGRFLFASEIKALLPLLPGTPDVNPRGLRQFLQNQFATGRETAVQGIERLLPGESLIVEPDLALRFHRYWTPRTQAIQKISEDEALEALDTLLAQVMVEHRRSDVPFGLFLSGGLDSGVLAALLQDRTQRPIQTWTLGYDTGRDTDRPGDELDPAARVARFLGLAHHPLRLDLPRLFARIPHSIWAADELMRDYASLPSLILADTAARSVKVVFSGEGGDEVFAGYRRYHPPVLERGFKALWRPGSGGFRVRGQWPRTWRHRLFGPALSALGPVERMPVLQAWGETPARWTDLQRRQYTDLVTALPDNLLVKTDRMLMAFGLEGRVPFLDHRLVEFGLSLPDALKIRGDVGKWLLRRWAEKRLPPDLLARPKRGFHVPVGDWLQGERVTRIGARLVANRGIRRWFHADRIPALVAAHRKRGGLSRPIWGLMQFAIWHRVFIDQPGLQPAPQEDPLEWI